MVEYGIDLKNNQFKNWRSLIDIQNDEDIQYYQFGFDMTDEDWQEGCRRIWEEIPHTGSKKTALDLEYNRAKDVWKSDDDVWSLQHAWIEFSDGMYGIAYADGSWELRADGRNGETVDVGIEFDDIYAAMKACEEAHGSMAKTAYQTNYGLEYDVVTEIDPSWSEYDKSVAQCHLYNYGEIYTDAQYGTPIDNEYDLMDIEDSRGVFASKTAGDWQPFDANLTPELKYDMLDPDEILYMYGSYTDESYRKIFDDGMLGVVTHHVGQVDEWWSWDTYSGFYGYGIDCGTCKSKEEGMAQCEWSFWNPGFTVNASKTADIEWEAYEVVDGFPTRDVPGYMYHHGYDGWYLIRHDDGWGDRHFGPYSSLGNLMSAHSLHDSDVKVSSKYGGELLESGYRHLLESNGFEDEHDDNYIFLYRKDIDGHVLEIACELIDGYRVVFSDGVDGVWSPDFYSFYDCMEDATSYMTDIRMASKKISDDERDEKIREQEMLVEERMHEFNEAICEYEDALEHPDYYDVELAKKVMDEAERELLLAEDNLAYIRIWGARKSASRKNATRTFTYAEMQELEDEVIDKPWLNNADRLKNPDLLIEF